MAPHTIANDEAFTDTARGQATPRLSLTLVGKIAECWWDLQSLSSYEPSPKVNALFSRLVSVCSGQPDQSVIDEVLTHPSIIKAKLTLQQICSRGESALEQYWAETIIAAKTPLDGVSLARDALAAFPYYTNYKQLTRMELNGINICSLSPAKKFAFIGCGPLPLTSLCILEQTGGLPSLITPVAPQEILVHNIDHCSVALDTADDLCETLDIPKTSMSFELNDATSLTIDLSEYDVVYVAALVGSTPTVKKRIFSQVMKRMRPGALLVVRSAKGLRSLLYPVVNVNSDFDLDLFEPVLEMHPYDNIVNSVIIGRVRDSLPRID